MPGHAFGRRILTTDDRCRPGNAGRVEKIQCEHHIAAERCRSSPSCVSFTPDEARKNSGAAT